MTSRVAETLPGVPPFSVRLERGSARYNVSPYKILDAGRPRSVIDGIECDLGSQSVQCDVKLVLP
jgi:hypothetical protein